MFGKILHRLVKKEEEHEDFTKIVTEGKKAEHVKFKFNKYTDASDKMQRFTTYH